MPNILVQPQQLRQKAELLRAHAQKIDQALLTIDQTLMSLKGDKFLGMRANAVQTRYAPQKEALLQAKNMVLRFAEELNLAASKFSNADCNATSSGGGGSILLEPPLKSGIAIYNDKYIDIPENEKRKPDIDRKWLWDDLLNEAISQYVSTPEFEEMIKKAKDAKIGFRLPNGIILGCADSSCHIIDIGFGKLTSNGVFDGNDGELIINSQGIFGFLTHEKGLASLILHEMQHGVDEELELYKVITDEIIIEHTGSTAELETYLSNNLSELFASEIRAYDVQGDFLGQRTTDAEIFKEYKEMYMEFLDERMEILGYDNVSITLDDNGNVNVDLGPIYAR